MKISTNGLKIIKHFEGLFVKAYVDPVGIWTIGYGHTGSVAYAGNEITEKKAGELLREDMKESESFVDRYIDVNLSQQQFDALVSFTFNVGGGALAKSTLRKKLNANDFEGAANEFLRWDKGTIKGKKVALPGLTRRRRSERHLFDTNEVVFFDGHGVVDPDGEGNETLTMVEVSSEPESMEAGGGAGFIAYKGLHTAGVDESILRDLGNKYGISFPVDLLIEHRNAHHPVSRPRFWAVVDFDLHSGKPRLFVLDVIEKEVNSYLCAHGKGSEGPTDDGFANVFKNKKGSEATSLGIYRCAEKYWSENNGQSMKLDGLEDTNSNARSRKIVMHGARYVSSDFASKYKRIGRSEGCPALDHKYVNNVIDQLKDGSFLIHWKAP